MLEYREAPAHLGIVVPAYFYPSPGSAWNQLTAAASRVPITAILNPNSGPGTSVDPNYGAAVDQLRAAGGKVLGYVHTSYAARPLADVEAEIDAYHRWYHIDGIFIDEMTSDANAGHLHYYEQIDHFVHHEQHHWIDVGNPGVNVPRSYINHAADEFVLFENGSGYDTYTPPAYQARRPARDFVNLLYNVPTAAAMQADVSLAVSRHTGSIFITDDTLPNPYDTLPSYWNQLVDAVAAANHHH